MTNEKAPAPVSKKHLARLERERIQNRYIITGSLIVLALVVLAILYGILDQTVIQPSRPVAEVNGSKVTQAEFKAAVAYTRYQIIMQYDQTLQFSQMFGSDPSFAQYFTSQLDQYQQQLADSNALGRQVLDQLIQDKLIVQEAEKLGLIVTEEEVEKAMQEAFQYYANGTPTPAPAPTEVVYSTLTNLQMELAATPTLIPDPETISVTETPTLAPTEEPTTTSTPAATALPTSTPTPHTLQGYETQVASYITPLAPYQFNKESLRDLFRAQLYRQKLTAELTKDIPSTQEQVWARHILIDDEAAAKSILVRLKNGESWFDLAAEFSKDTSNKDQGGDLQWFARGKMVSEFEEAAFALKVGETSQPIKTSFGYHIIQVLGHEDRPLIASELDELKNIKFSDYLTAAKDAAKITENSIWEKIVPTEPALQTQ